MDREVSWETGHVAALSGIAIVDSYVSAVYHFSRSRDRERETQLQINDNIEGLALNHSPSEPTLAAKKKPVRYRVFDMYVQSPRMMQ
jgi:hypothetical protein